jgi:hypothetical protein
MSNKQIRKRKSISSLSREDRKNLVKNFVKAFRKFINNLEEKQSIEDNFDGKSNFDEILEYCNQFIDKRNFNN